MGQCARGVSGRSDETSHPLFVSRGCVRSQLVRLWGRGYPAVSHIGWARECKELGSNKTPCSHGESGVEAAYSNVCGVPCMVHGVYACNLNQSCFPTVVDWYALGADGMLVISSGRIYFV